MLACDDALPDFFDLAIDRGANFRYAGIAALGAGAGDAVTVRCEHAQRRSKVIFTSIGRQEVALTQPTQHFEFKVVVPFAKGLLPFLIEGRFLASFAIGLRRLDTGDLCHLGDIGGLGESFEESFASARVYRLALVLAVPLSLLGLGHNPRSRLCEAVKREGATTWPPLFE